MPGITEVKLLDQGDDFVIVQTNEGIMKRTNISIEYFDNKVLIEFDERYQAGKMLTTVSHFKQEFKIEDNSINHKLLINLQKAPSFMGLLYRTFGSKNIGKAFLEAHKQYYKI